MKDKRSIVTMEEMREDDLKSIDIKLSALEKYECDCFYDQLDDGHSSNCSIVISKEIARDLLIEKMKWEIGRVEDEIIAAENESS